MTATFNALEVLQGRNLQTEVLLRMSVLEINSAATCYRPDLRASTADVVAWASMWNKGPHFMHASIVRFGDTAQTVLIDKDDMEPPISTEQPK